MTQIHGMPSMFTPKPKSLTAGLIAFLAGSMIFGASAPPPSQSGTSSRRDLPAFWKSRLEDVENSVGYVKKGTMSVLARTPGGRNVYLVAYGERDSRRGTANYNSAAGGRDPASYALKDGTQKPVVFLLGPVHGQEFEGVAGLLNLIQVAETGRDLRDRPWPELSANLARCRVLIVPCGSRDARARCR